MNNNRMISALLVFTLVLSMAVFVSADNPASLQLGDTTGDGAIDAGDALEVLQHSVGKREKFTAEWTTSGDNAGGVPIPPRQYDTLAQFKQWAETATLPPEGFNYNRIESNYLIPGDQDMLIIDRYFLVPEVSEEFTFLGILDGFAYIQFVFENEKGEYLYCSYYTAPQLLSDHISAETTTLKRYNGVDYYVNEVENQVIRSYDGYVITLSTNAHNATLTTDQMMETFITCSKVTLPPLKTTIQ